MTEVQLRTGWARCAHGRPLLLATKSALQDELTLHRFPKRCIQTYSGQVLLLASKKGVPQPKARRVLLAAELQ